MWTEVLKEILEGIDLETDVSIGLMGLRREKFDYADTVSSSN